MSIVASILRTIQKGMNGCATFPRCGNCTGVNGECSVVNKCINDIKEQLAIPAPAPKKAPSTKAPDPRKIQTTALIAKTSRKKAAKK